MITMVATVVDAAADVLLELMRTALLLKECSV